MINEHGDSTNVSANNRLHSAFDVDPFNKDYH